MSVQKADPIGELPLPNGAAPQERGGSLRAISLGLVAITCIVVGVLHPLATDATKDARLRVCEGSRHNCHDGPRVMPFFPLTLTLASQFVSVVMSSLVACLIFGRQETIRHLLDTKKLYALWPLGLIYGVGDFCQTIACSQASGTMVVIVAQSKLLITAAMTRALMGRKGHEQWSKLVWICVAAMASVYLRVHNTSMAMQKAGEMVGAVLALFKASSSALGAVMSEMYYKQVSESFWILSARVQTLMLATSLLLYTRELQMGTIPWSISDALMTGPAPICSFDEGLENGWCDPSASYACQCVTHAGWDLRTCIAMLAIGANGLVTGLTLRYLSAVGKSICNVLGLVAFYFIYVGLGLEAFHWGQLFLVYLIVAKSYSYAAQKQKVASART
mmetsp:Transcript_56355/g.104261  ORF Transcript_56355/g.104261 Transcript_56355/m.104261 type:complete len:390 (-) Transcript_56355:138-1307(-)